MSRITSTIAAASAVAIFAIMSALPPAWALEKHKHSLTSDLYSAAAFDRAVVSNFNCGDENRVPCTTSPHLQNGGGEGGLTDGRTGPRCNYHLWSGNINGPWMPCREKRNLYETLVFFHNTVHKHIDVQGKGFWYSLVFGTAMGSLRNADIVDWDTDVDIVVPGDQMQWLSEVLHDAAAKATPPYELTHGTWKGNEVSRLYVSHENSAHVDIWHGKNLDPAHPQECIAIGPYMYRAAALFPLQSCSLQDSAFPCFAEGYKLLEQKYGKDWMVPGNNKGGSNSLCQQSAGTVRRVGTSGDASTALIKSGGSVRSDKTRGDARHVVIESTGETSIVDNDVSIDYVGDDDDDDFVITTDATRLMVSALPPRTGLIKTTKRTQDVVEACSMEINHYKYKSDTEYADKCAAYHNGFMQDKCDAHSELQRKKDADATERITTILRYGPLIKKSMKSGVGGGVNGEVYKVTVDGANVLVGKTSALDHKFFLSVVAIFRGEDDYLEEWLHYYIIQGVDHFYLYSNENGRNTEQLLHHYVASGYVTLVDWPDAKIDLLAPKEQRRHWNDYSQKSVQNQAYMHFSRNFKDRSEWVMKIDVDEFAFPSGKCNTLKQVLDVGERDAELYMIPRFDMGSSGHATRPTGLVIESYTKSEESFSARKSIARASNVDPSDFESHKFLMIPTETKEVEKRGMITVYQGVNALNGAQRK